MVDKPSPEQRRKHAERRLNSKKKRGGITWKEYKWLPRPVTLVRIYCTKTQLAT